MTIKCAVTQTFDGVFIANGRYQEVYQPTLQCQEKFTGRIFNSQTFKTVGNFAKRRTLVIGFGHTACDTASALASMSSQVYMASRQKRQWLASRSGFLGLPHDHLTETRFFHWLFTIAPRLHMNLLEFFTSLRLDRSTVASCANKQLISNKTQVVSDELRFYVLSGQVVVKPNVERFIGGNQVLFEDGIKLDIDDVVFCTGYTQAPSILKQDKIRNCLYKLRYLIWEEDDFSKQHNTLCFVGMAAPRGALAPISEMQARLHCAVLTGRVKLPTCKVMEREVLMFAGRESGISQAQIRGLPYLDDLAAILRIKPNIWRILFVDPFFAIKCLFLAAVPYQFRLQGHGAWSGAKDAMQRSWSTLGVLGKGRQILTTASTKKPQNGHACQIDENKKSSKLSNISEHYTSILTSVSCLFLLILRIFCGDDKFLLVSLVADIDFYSFKQ